MLVKTPELEEIAVQIPAMGDDLGKLVNKFLRIRRPDYKGVYRSDVMGLVGELHVRSALINTAAQTTNIVCNPIKDETSADGMILKERKRGSVKVVYEDKPDKTICEIDGLIAVTGVAERRVLPVFIEVNLSKRYKSKKLHEGRRKTEDLMTREHLERYLPISRAFFGTENFAYFLVIYNELIQEKREAQKQFFEMGGMVVGFPYGKNEYEHMLRAVLKQKGVTVRKDNHKRNGRKRKQNFAYDKRQNGYYPNGNSH